MDVLHMDMKNKKKVQLPLPDHIDETKILDAISADKDVDGFQPLGFFFWRFFLGFLIHALMCNEKHPGVDERIYGVATMSRLLKIIGLFCKRSL